jgi:hypothetical protein
MVTVTTPLVAVSGGDVAAAKSAKQHNGGGSAVGIG